MGALLLLCAAVEVRAQQLYTVLDPRTGGAVYCSVEATIIEPGTLARDGSTFQPLLLTINQLKRQVRRFPQNANLKARLKTQQTRYRRLRALCLANRPATPPSMPTPTATPTPSPTSAPSCPNGGCFNAQRNTSCFRIPNTLVGNETRGTNLSSSCLGCHVERQLRNRTYSQIVNALNSVPDMAPFRESFSNQDVADIAAYLNRFNPLQCRSDWP